MLKLSLIHSYDDFLLDVDFHAPRGITALWGKSGSGKTTIINAISGIIKPDYGRLEIDGELLFDSDLNLFIPAHQRRLGYIFQDARLFPHLNVKQNIYYGHWFWHKIIKNQPQSSFSAHEIIELLNLGNLLNRHPNMLSGGEKQRVALARALLSFPRLLLADEPLSALDEDIKSEIIMYFKILNDEFNLPMIYVSHQHSEVAQLANQVIMIDSGGVLLQGNVSDVFSNPLFYEHQKRDIGALIETRLLCHHLDGTSELAAGSTRFFIARPKATIGDIIRIRIAANDVILSTSPPIGLSALNIAKGVICDISPMKNSPDNGVIVTVKLDGGKILAQLSQRSLQKMELVIGTTIFVIIKSLAIEAS